MSSAIRFWFSFSYPKVAYDPINQHERMQQGRLRAHVSHTDVGLYLPISVQLSISLLISLRSWLNTRVLILVWGQIWNIWGWIIDAIPPLQWAFCRRQVCTKFIVMISVTVFVISRPVCCKIPYKSPPSVPFLHSVCIPEYSSLGESQDSWGVDYWWHIKSLLYESQCGTVQMLFWSGLFSVFLSSFWILIINWQPCIHLFFQSALVAIVSQPFRVVLVLPISQWVLVINFWMFYRPTPLSAIFGIVPIGRVPSGPNHMNASLFSSLNYSVDGDADHIKSKCIQCLHLLLMMTYFHFMQINVVFYWWYCYWLTLIYNNNYTYCVCVGRVPLVHLTNVPLHGKSYKQLWAFAFWSKFYTTFLWDWIIMIYIRNYTFACFFILGMWVSHQDSHNWKAKRIISGQNYVFLNHCLPNRQRTSNPRNSSVFLSLQKACRVGIEKCQWIMPNLSVLLDMCRQFHLLQLCCLC